MKKKLFDWNYRYRPRPVDSKRHAIKIGSVSAPFRSQGTTVEGKLHPSLDQWRIAGHGALGILVEPKIIINLYIHCVPALHS
jgi:hypothetical protein